MADIILPAPADDEEYVLRKKPKTLLQVQREARDLLQAELDATTEPSNEELRELGKAIHPYWQKKTQLDFIKEEINRLQA